MFHFHAMDWVTRKKGMGVLRRELACLYLLLLLIMSPLETPCYAVGYRKFSSFKGGSSSELKNNPAKSSNIGGLKGNADKDDFLFCFLSSAFLPFRNILKLLLEISTVNVSGSLTDVYESLGLLGILDLARLKREICVNNTGFARA
ncbi:hypothetical protein POTOM_052386 [Populus tomentosa]|uniref:Uncharacterized protein n=1 Tax=Populus tomentosa TaxID=118781 RepID=A0A8X7Y551_POPTO|nr:hypothetical protein POTOM_052386 [Populus tomentosa]